MDVVKFLRDVVVVVVDVFDVSMISSLEGEALILVFCNFVVEDDVWDTLPRERCVATAIIYNCFVGYHGVKKLSENFLFFFQF